MAKAAKSTPLGVGTALEDAAKLASGVAGSLNGMVARRKLDVKALRAARDHLSLATDVLIGVIALLPTTGEPK